MSTTKEYQDKKRLAIRLQRSGDPEYNVPLRELLALPVSLLRAAAASRGGEEETR